MAIIRPSPFLFVFKSFRRCAASIDPQEVQGGNPVDIQQPSSCGEGFSVRSSMMRAHIVEKDKAAGQQQPDDSVDATASFQPGWVCLKELICKAGNCGHCHQCHDGVLPSESRRKKQENEYLLSPEGTTATTPKQWVT